MFEEKTIQRSAENLRRLQEKILGPENSSICRGKRTKVDNIQRETKIFPCGKIQTKTRVIFKK
jgi:hypothetical protein